MARTDDQWEPGVDGTFIQTISPSGYNILINGSNKYLNFNSISGSSGYGIRDNGGTMEFKNSGGSWAALGSGGSSSPLTTKGDLYTFTTVDARLAVGTNGQLLSADSTQTTGLKWIDAPSTNAAGSDTQVQFNDGGTAFGGNAKFTFNKTTGATLINGQITTALGSAGAPAYSFNGDADTGIYSATGNQLNFATGGTQWMQIRSDGKIGMGNNLAFTAFALDIRTTANGPSSIHITNTSTGSLAEASLALMNDAGSGDTKGELFLNGGNNTNYGGVNSLNLYNYNSNGALTFGTGAADPANERMRISSAGAIKFNVYGSGSITGTAAYALQVDSSGNVIEGVLVTGSSTTTFTNKRITKRVVTVTQSATPTVNSDNTDIAKITGLAQAITSMSTNLSGTPIFGDVLEFYILDDGSARAITWGASFSSGAATLPSSTTISTELWVKFYWNGSTWTCMARSY